MAGQSDAKDQRSYTLYCRRCILISPIIIHRRRSVVDVISEYKLQYRVDATAIGREREPSIVTWRRILRNALQRPY